MFMNAGVSVARVRAMLVRLPLERPVAIATRAVRERAWLLVGVEDERGLRGLGFAFAGYEGGGAARDLAEALLAPEVIGIDPADVALIWSSLAQTAARMGRDGTAARAVSALDIALWDLAAKQCGLPLWALVGGVRREVPVYVGAGYYGADDDIATLRAEATRLAGAGYASFKLKVGRLDLDDDLRRVEAFAGMAPSGDLVVDANGAWTIPQTIAAASALAACGVRAIEDPLPPSELPVYRELRSRVPIEITAGEHFGSPSDFEHALTLDALDYVQLDATACGGITAFLKIAELCAGRSVPIETHWFPDLHAQLAMAAPGVRRIETFADHLIVNFGAIASGGARLSPRTACPGDAPGHGIKLVRSVAERLFA